MVPTLIRDAPIRVIEEVVVAGGGESRHRAWPSAERAPSGDLVVAYRSGDDHHLTDQGTLYITRSQDGGRTWPITRPLASEPGWGTYTNHGMTSLSDGTMLLHVIRGQNHGPRRESMYARARYTRSRDGGITWEPYGPVLDFPFLSPDERGFPYGGIQELTEDRLMVPFYGIPKGATDLNQRILAVIFSNDRGETWDDYSLIYAEDSGDICPSEADIIRLDDGRFLAVARANAAGLLYRCTSDDEGSTWTSLEPTSMPGQCPSLLRLNSGDLLCAYRETTEGQPGMSCAVSRDDGSTWDALGSLYHGSNWDCAYPSLVRSTGTQIFCAFYTSAEQVGDGLDCEIRGLLLEDVSG